MRKILSNQAPKPIGPYSQAMKSGETLFISGQIGLDPATGAMTAVTIQEQTEQVMKNLEAILKTDGKTFENVVKTTCLLTDMGDFAAFNEIYARYMVSKPARSTFAVVALPANALVEVELIAE